MHRQTNETYPRKTQSWVQDQKISESLTVPGPRLPITKDQRLFRQVAEFGNRLLFWHTYGDRDLLCKGLSVEPGQAKHPHEIPSSPLPESYRYQLADETIKVGDGTYTHVLPEVWNYTVSGFKPVQSWLAYRMKKRAGRAGQADDDSLDAIRPTCWPDQRGEEFLCLLWIVEKTIDAEAEGKHLLGEVLAGDVFQADELPIPTGQDRRPLGVDSVESPDELPEEEVAGDDD